MLVFLYTVCDIGTVDISGKRDEKFSRVVGIIDGWQCQASGPSEQGVDINNSEGHTEGTD